MKTYNTYQEAKIANPESEIYVSMAGYFASEKYVANIALCGIKEGWNKCDPSDYCMTLAEFLGAGHLLVDGDVLIGTNGYLAVIGKDYYESAANKIIESDKNRYILRAAALEEKIGTTDDDRNELKPSCRVEFDTTPKQVESLGCGAEWDGNGLPPVGVICEAFDYDKDDWVEVKTLDAVSLSNEMAVAVTMPNGGFSKVFWAVTFRKPETTQQREEREVIADLCNLVESDEYVNSLNVNLDCSVAMRAVIDLVAKAGYRKESK